MSLLVKAVESGGQTDNLVKMGKWSDGQQLVLNEDGSREESEEVYNKVKNDINGLRWSM